MNDKAGFLGVGKVHIRCNYSILVCTIPYQAF